MGSYHYLLLAFARVRRYAWKPSSLLEIDLFTVSSDLSFPKSTRYSDVLVRKSKREIDIITQG